MFTVVCTSIALSASSVLSAVGFKASGVAAGSIAAGVQASIGSVKAGSAFAAAQSLGATGALIPGIGHAIALFGLLVGGIAALTKMGKKSKSK